MNNKQKNLGIKKIKDKNGKIIFKFKVIKPFGVVRSFDSTPLTPLYCPFYKMWKKLMPR